MARKSVVGYQAITWLAGQVFINREFVDEVEGNGFEAIYKECPYDDLTPDQRATFEAAFNKWQLRLLVRVWWVTYDYLRKHGSLPGVKSPWRP